MRFQDRHRRGFFTDEEGFTTTSMVLSLLIALSLVFMTAQVYRINAASAQVQDVADAAALAAENQVSDFVLAARLCDAVVLSLSLTGITLYGVGTVALCVPATADIADGLIDAAQKTLHARDVFADESSEALNRLQKLLPYLAAVRAASVAAANNATQQGANYIGVALLVPFEGKDVAVDVSDEAEKQLSSLADQADEMKRKAQELDDASKEASEAKERAFLRDCGDNPGYCLYERAASLGDLAEGDNPLYTSVDAWSFSVALERARAYYRARLANEKPENSSVEEGARSALRRNFYRYACEQLEKAYVHEDDGHFDAYFPHLPRNTEEMRKTSLYTDPIYPVTVSGDGAAIMHAWDGCPNAAGATQRGSLAQLDAGEFEGCSLCGLSVSSMGNVAAASTSIPNGFEYHYEAIAQAAEEYEEARKRSDPLMNEMKNKASSIFDLVSQALRALGSKRIEPAPPGRLGAIALVVNASEASAQTGFENSFVRSSGTLGPRAALAGATLVADGSDEGRNAITSLLDGFKEQSSPLGAAGVALDCWSAALAGYTEGQEALTGSFEHVLDSLPLVSASGIGSWASAKLKKVIEAVGLQPARLEAVKPALVNTGHVASASDEESAQRYLAIKRFVVAYPLDANDPFASLLDGAEDYLHDWADENAGSLELAVIELFDGAVRIPLVIPLPDQVRSYPLSLIDGLFDRIRAARATPTGGALWE